MPTCTRPITGTSIPKNQNQPMTRCGLPCSGRDAFHRVAEIIAGNWDAVERVPASMGTIAHAVTPNNSAPAPSVAATDIWSDSG